LRRRAPVQPDKDVRRRKTTAMRVLARAWTDSGGEVLGLAHSAIAAGELRKQIGAHSDTLARLTWSVTTGSLPGLGAGHRARQPGRHRRGRDGRHD
jgi:hypothetical protein